MVGALWGAEIKAGVSGKDLRCVSIWEMNSSLEMLEAAYGSLLHPGDAEF